jgi:hypothetical protein
MAAGDKPRGPSDATDYSSTKAPETQKEAEQQEPDPDPRLHPGGAHGSAADTGMSSLDWDSTATKGQAGPRPGLDVGKDHQRL